MITTKEDRETQLDDKSNAPNATSSKAQAVQRSPVARGERMVIGRSSGTTGEFANSDMRNSKPRDVFPKKRIDPAVNRIESERTWHQARKKARSSFEDVFLGWKDGKAISEAPSAAKQEVKMKEGDEGGSSSSESLVEVIDGRIIKKRKKTLPVASARRTVKPPSSSSEEVASETTTGGKKEVAKLTSQTKATFRAGGARLDNNPKLSSPLVAMELFPATKSTGADGEHVPRKEKGKQSVTFEPEPKLDDEEIDQLASDYSPPHSRLVCNEVDTSRVPQRQNVEDSWHVPKLASRSRFRVPAQPVHRPLSVPPIPPVLPRGPSKSPDASDDSVDIPPFPPGTTNYYALTPEQRHAWKATLEKALERDKFLYAKRAAKQQAIARDNKIREKAQMKQSAMEEEAFRRHFEEARRSHSKQKHRELEKSLMKVSAVQDQERAKREVGPSTSQGSRYIGGSVAGPSFSSVTRIFAGARKK